jgi:uroporphyrinogen decarboxylase
MPLTPRERIQAALAHERPDRCPFQASFTPEFARRLRADLEARGSIPKAAESRTEASGHNPHGRGNAYDLERAIGEDMLLTSVGWANSYYQAEEPYTDEWGIRWEAEEYETPFGPGRYTEMRVHPLADASALGRYAPPDPNRPGLYVEAERAIRDFGKDYWIVGVAVTTIWETAWALRGLERLLFDLLDDPDLADRILDIPYRYHRTAARRLTELGVDMIWLGDDVGGQKGMIISPAQWRRFLKPRLASIIAEIKAANAACKIAYHSDGDIAPIIPELIEIGVDVLNPIQPACMDPAVLKTKYGDRLSFWGSIDEQRTLPFGAPADVVREVNERLATIGRGGGLIIGPTHHVQLDTPMENFWAMVDAVTNPAARRA